MKIAINQPCFIPWVGYFNLISNIDYFIFFDIVKISKRTPVVRSRVINKNKDTLYWATLFFQKRYEKQICKHIDIDYSFLKKLFNQLDEFYPKKSKENFYFIKKILSDKKKSLAEYNANIIIQLSNYLGIKTKFAFASDILKNENINYNEITGAELIKLILLKNKKKYNKFYNFENGIKKNLKPYIDKDFFITNNISLYQQLFRLKYCYDEKSNNYLSIIHLILNGEKIELDLIKNYSNFKKIF
jgi:hypothetical protein